MAKVEMGEEAKEMVKDEEVEGMTLKRGHIGQRAVVIRRMDNMEKKRKGMMVAVKRTKMEETIKPKVIIIRDGSIKVKGQMRSHRWAIHRFLASTTTRTNLSKLPLLPFHILA